MIPLILTINFLKIRIFQVHEMYTREGKWENYRIFFSSLTMQHIFQEHVFSGNLHSKCIIQSSSIFAFVV